MSPGFTQPTEDTKLFCSDSSVAGLTITCEVVAATLLAQAPVTGGGIGAVSL